MKRRVLVVMLLLVAVMTLYSAAVATAADGSMYYTKSAVEFRDGMRKLWTDHVVYTHDYIVSALADLPDAGAIAERLLKNQDEIGNAIAPYYGDAAGKKLTALLRAHIAIAAEVVAAAKSGDKAALEKAQKKWTGNAEEIAAFLAGANPNWSYDTLNAALQKHLSLTTDDVTARLGKDWVKDMAAYDMGYTHMLGFSDTLADGIITQFPDKFK